MSDNEGRRRGGGFTFLIALAAFIMSATALYQINEDRPFVQGLKERLAEAKRQGSDWIASELESVADAITLDGIVDLLRQARDLASRDGGLDNAKELLERIGQRIDDYIRFLQDREGEIDPELEQELRGIQMSVSAMRAASSSSPSARRSGASASADPVADLDRLIERAEEAAELAPPAASDNGVASSKSRGGATRDGGRDS